jgi:hypothetical protein
MAQPAVVDPTQLFKPLAGKYRLSYAAVHIPRLTVGLAAHISATMLYGCMQGIAKPKREESIYCTSACDMLRMSLEDAISLCDIYPAVSV